MAAFVAIVQLPTESLLSSFASYHHISQFNISIPLIQILTSAPINAILPAISFALHKSTVHTEQAMNTSFILPGRFGNRSYYICGTVFR